MSRRRRGAARALLAGGALVASLLATAPVAAAAGREPPPPTLRAADRALLERVLADSGVDRRLSGADLRGYLSHLSGKLGQRLTARIVAAAGAVTGSALVVASAVLIAVAAAVLLWALTRWIRHRWRRRGTDERPRPVPAAAAAAPGCGEPARWRAELERRLAEGRLAEALEAAWWWLALTLAGDRADPSWTNRELLERAVAAGDVRRRLAPLLAGFDALAYGPRRPTAAAVRGLVAALEGELA